MMFTVFLGLTGSVAAQTTKMKTVAPVSPAEVASVRIYPNKIRLGESARLVIWLRRPAAKGGTVIGVGQDSDGTAETLVQTPASFTLLPGVRRVDYLIRTARVENPAKRIVFCASTHSPVICGSGTQGAILILYR